MISEFVVEGLKSTQRLEIALKNKIHNLLEFSPSDSNALATLRKNAENYEGIIQIVSSQGRFVSRAVGRNMSDVVRKISRELRGQLRHWRIGRFQTES